MEILLLAGNGYGIGAQRGLYEQDGMGALLTRIRRWCKRARRSAWDSRQSGTETQTVIILLVAAVPRLFRRSGT